MPTEITEKTDFETVMDRLKPKSVIVHSSCMISDIKDDNIHIFLSYKDFNEVFKEIDTKDGASSSGASTITDTEGE